MAHMHQHAWIARTSRFSGGRNGPRSSALMLFRGGVSLNRPPSMSISKRVKEKQGLYHRKPIGGLKKYPSASRNANCSGSNEDKDNGDQEEEDDGQFEEDVKEEKKKKDEEKKRRKREKPPTSKEIRQRIEQIVMLHGKLVEEETPSLYPLLFKAKKKKKGASTIGKSTNSSIVRNRPIGMEGAPVASRKSSGNKTRYLLAHEAHKVMR